MSDNIIKKAFAFFQRSYRQIDDHHESISETPQSTYTNDFDNFPFNPSSSSSPKSSRGLPAKSIVFAPASAAVVVKDELSMSMMSNVNFLKNQCHQAKEKSKLARDCGLRRSKKLIRRTSQELQDSLRRIRSRANSYSFVDEDDEDDGSPDQSFHQKVKTIKPKPPKTNKDIDDNSANNSKYLLTNTSHFTTPWIRQSIRKKFKKTKSLKSENILKTFGHHLEKKMETRSQHSRNTSKSSIDSGISNLCYEERDVDQIIHS